MKKTQNPIDQALMRKAKALAQKLVKALRQTERDESLDDQTCLRDAVEMAREFLWQSVTTDLWTGEPKLLDPALSDFDEDLLADAVWGEVFVIPDDAAVDDIARQIYRRWQEKKVAGHRRRRTKRSA